MGYKTNDRPGQSIGINTGHLERVAVADLKRNPSDARHISKQDRARAELYVARYSDRPLPVMTDGQNHVLVGQVFVEAARKLRISHLLVVRQHGLDPTENLLFSTAANQLLTLGSWDADLMDKALREFESTIPDFSGALLGFAPGELDRIVGSAGPNDDANAVPEPAANAISRLGSCWQAGPHRILCGDSTTEDPLRLMDGRFADVAIVDPPFGCKIQGFVSKGSRHREFVEGSGDKSDLDLLEFFRRLCVPLERALKPRGLAYLSQRNVRFCPHSSRS
jgi:hypothetical protein